MKKLVNKLKDTLSIFSSSKGFTLLELLVVVLIIGILAGIALPQYEKSVEKTRLAEALLNASSLQRAIDVFTLTNGYPNSGVSLLDPDSDYVLDIDITQSMHCELGWCYTKYFSYNVGCDVNMCSIGIIRADDQYEIGITKNKENDNWDEKICLYSSKYEYICKYLESQGFEREGC